MKGGFGIGGLQLVHEGAKWGFLLGGASVLGRESVFVKPTDVADADAVGIVSLAVGTCFGDGTKKFKRNS